MSKHTELLRLYASTVERYEAAIASPHEIIINGMTLESLHCTHHWRDLGNDDQAHLNLLLSKAAAEKWSSIRLTVVELAKAEMQDARDELDKYERANGIVSNPS